MLDINDSKIIDNLILDGIIEKCNELSSKYNDKYSVSKNLASNIIKDSDIISILNIACKKLKDNVSKNQGEMINKIVEYAFCMTFENNREALINSFINYFIEAVDISMNNKGSN